MRPMTTGANAPPMRADIQMNPWPRAPAVAEPAARYLEERVAEGEGAEHDAESLVADVQVALNVLLHAADADAVEVRNKGQSAGERQNAEAHARRAGRKGRDTHE